MDDEGQIRLLPRQTTLSLSASGCGYDARVLISVLNTANEVQSLKALLDPNASGGGAFTANYARMAAASTFGATLLDEFLVRSEDTTCSYYHREYPCGGCPVVVACSMCGCSYCSTECWVKDHRQIDEHDGEARLVCPYERRSILGFGALPLMLVHPAARIEQIILLDEDEDFTPSGHGPSRFKPYLVMHDSTEKKSQLLVYASPRGFNKFGARFLRLRLETAPSAAAAAVKGSFDQEDGLSSTPSLEKKAGECIAKLKVLRRDFLKSGTGKEEEEALCSWWKSYAEEHRSVVAAALSDTLLNLDVREFLLVCDQLSSVWDTTRDGRNNLWIRPATNVLDWLAELRLEPESPAASLAIKILTSFRGHLSNLFIGKYMPNLWKMLTRYSANVVASEHFARAGRQVCAQASNPSTLQAKREKTAKVLRHFVDSTVQSFRAEHKTGSAQSLAPRCLELFCDVCVRNRHSPRRRPRIPLAGAVGRGCPVQDWGTGSTRRGELCFLPLPQNDLQFLRLAQTRTSLL